MISTRSRIRAALTALLAVPMMAGLATAQDTRPTVAVLYFDNNSIGRDRADYDGLGKGVADLLITDLAANNNVRVIERDRLQALLQEQNLTKDGAIDPQTAIRIGKLLGAHHMVYGGFMNTGRGQMVLTARTVQVETGVISNPQKVQATGDDVLALISQMSTRLASTMRLPALERRTGDAGHGAHGATAAQAGREVATAKEPAKQPKLDLKTAMLYSKALEAEDSGDRSKAVELYNQVLDKFPNLESARKNRDKLQSAGN